MSRIGWICCDGERRTDEQCLAHGMTHHCSLSPLLVSAIGNTIDRDLEDPTVTELIGCLRQYVLSQTQDYYDQPDNYYAVFRGTLFHGVLDLANLDGDYLIERRYRRRLPSGFEVSGKPDVIVPTKHLIIDVKSSAWMPKKPWPSQVLQLNAYRWLVAPTHDVFNLEILYMDMKKAVRMPVELMSDAEVVAFLEERAAIVAHALNGGQLPEVLDITKSWMCKTCAFASECWPDGVPSDYQRKKARQNS